MRLEIYQACARFDTTRLVRLCESRPGSLEMWSHETTTQHELCEGEFAKIFELTGDLSHLMSFLWLILVKVLVFGFFIEWFMKKAVFSLRTDEQTCLALCGMRHVNCYPLLFFSVTPDVRYVSFIS